MTAERVLEIFKEITTIPRESGHEGPMTEYLQKWAAAHALECKTDSIGNVNIIKEAAAGKEQVPALVFQCHQDMVCEKNNGVEHDFRKDPINYVIENGWMVAPDTTLGADDGIGIAACLALLESDLPTGKIECVFTISEETGMDGANAMQEGFFTGKTLVNLDSEEEGEFCIGCAGGLNTTATFSYTEVPVNEGWQRMKIRIYGGLGGHSGENIKHGRANTVQQMARFLYTQLPCIQLISYNGGGKSNAIARECEAVVAVKDAAALSAAVQKFSAALAGEFHNTDPDVRAEAVAVNCTCPAVDPDTTEKLVRSLCCCPHGVQSWSQDIANLVETSTNLASVKFQNGCKVLVTTSQRSSTLSEKHMIADMVEAAFLLAGAQVEHFNEYPGWQPDMNSNILKVSVEAYKKLFGVEPIVKAIHAGLECGLFLDKFPGLDMISFGPTLSGVHAPGEKMEIASLYKFVDHLTEVVCSFK